MLGLQSNILKYKSKTSTLTQLIEDISSEVRNCQYNLCEAKVICKCTVCFVYLCYEHAHQHTHSMGNFEILN